jgi:hypothetical protein
VKVLATSREVLGAVGEALWPVPPLAVPGPEEAGGSPEALARFDAVRLFAERAALADPGFQLDAESGPAVAELCRRLDGMPLAIELAAARVGALPAGELLERLGDRFGLLAGGGRTADPRQRTLRATVDWSFQLLGEADRRLFRRLAVFAGGCTVAAAEAVCGGDGLRPQDVLEGLFRLADRSLVVAAGGRPAASGCWRRCAPTARNGCPRPARPTPSSAATPPVPGPGRAGRPPPQQSALAAPAGRRLRQHPRRAGRGHRPRRPPDRAAPGRGARLVLVHVPPRGGLTAPGRLLALAADQPPSPQLALALQAAAMVEALLTPTGAAVDAAAAWSCSSGSATGRRLPPPG